MSLADDLSSNGMPVWGVLLLVAVLGGIIASMIASTRGLSAGGYFVFGFLLPLIGIIVACVAQPSGPRRDIPPQPPDWYADPWGKTRLRYYDGKEWTHHTAD